MTVAPSPLCPLALAFARVVLSHAGFVAERYLSCLPDGARAVLRAGRMPTADLPAGRPSDADLMALHWAHPYGAGPPEGRP